MTTSSATPALQLLQDFQQVQAHRAEVYTRFSLGFRDFLDHGQERLFARLMQEITPQFSAVSQQVIHIESCLRSPAVGRPDLAALLRQVQELERNKLKLTLSWQALRAAHAAGRFSWQSEADRPCCSSHRSQQQKQQEQLMALLERVQLAQSSHAADDVKAGSSDQQGNASSGSQVEGFMTVKPGFYEQQLQQAVAAAAAAEHHQNANGSSSSSSSTAAQQADQHDHGHQQQEQQQQHSHQHHGCCGGHHGHGHGPPDPLVSNPLEPSEAEYNAAVKEALQELDVCVVAINEVLEEVRYAVLELQEGQDS